MIRTLFLGALVGAIVGLIGPDNWRTSVAAILAGVLVGMLGRRGR